MQERKSNKSIWATLTFAAVFSFALQFLDDPIKWCNNPLRGNQLPLTSVFLTSRPTRTFSDTSQSPPCIEQLLTQHGNTQAWCWLFLNGPHDAGPGCLQQNFNETREPLPVLSYHIMSSDFLWGCGELNLRFKIKVLSESSLQPMIVFFTLFRTPLTASVFYFQVWESFTLYFLPAPPLRASLRPQILQEIKHCCPLEVNLPGMWGAPQPEQSRGNVKLHYTELSVWHSETVEETLVKATQTEGQRTNVKINPCFPCYLDPYDAILLDTP